jgi:hypothetical protein
VAARYRLNQEIKFLYIKNEQLYKNQLKCITYWHNTWLLIQNYKQKQKFCKTDEREREERKKRKKKKEKPTN